MNKKPKLVYGIKGKLVSAACMLLVAVIMVVSSTYAWFTLSTAPEVTGINTAVGANGSLEMALLPTSGEVAAIGSSATDGTLAFGDLNADKNRTWGNLVDVSHLNYGLQDITLYPSQLKLNDDGTFNTTGTLATPVYTPDGRVEELKANTVTGTYNATEKAFYQNKDSEQYGVRAVGVASGMSGRQLDFRNARAAVLSAMNMAKTLAAQSLNANGNALANVALKQATADNPTFTQDDVASLQAIVDALQGTETIDGVLPKIEEAYMNALLAFAASSAFEGDDVAYAALKGTITSATSLSDVITKLKDEGVTLHATLETAIAALQKTQNDVAAADELLQDLEDDGDSIAWGDGSTTGISAPVYKLVSVNALKVNGIAVSDVQSNMQELVNSVLSQNGLKITMASGGGVYADVADHCGDYDASITIDEVTYGGMTLNEMPARMETKTGVNPVYLSGIYTALTVSTMSPEDAAEGSLPISEFYGYIIDMAFRTNAKDSHLLLQTDAVDRIYGDNKNDETMGHGSSMTFKAVTTDFSDTQVKKLMENIRIVFFIPGADNNTILAYAKLDVANAQLVADGWQANMYLCTKVEDENGGVTEVLGKEEGQNRITALTQNVATKVSVLVYLDGEGIGNPDVAATAAQSLTGKMNLQFASDANLVPMDYADLHQKGNQNNQQNAGQ